MNHCTAVSKQILISTPLYLSCCLLAHDTKPRSHPEMGGIPCLAPGSSCLAHSVSKPSSWNLGDGWLWRCHVDGGTGKARSSGSLTGTQELSGESLLCSAVPCWPCQWPLTHLSCRFLHTSSNLTAFLIEPRCAKQKLNFSAMCSPWPPLFLLLFPTAGAP